MGIKVVFQPEGKTGQVAAGTKLHDAATQLGVVINSPCGGEGKCGKCVVRVVKGAGRASKLDRQHIPEEHLEMGYRLACQMRLLSDCVVTVPLASRLLGHRVLVSGLRPKADLRPSVHKQYAELDPPSVEDNVADADRLQRHFQQVGSELRVHPDLLGHLATTIRHSGFRLTAIVRGEELIGVEEGDTTRSIHGIAFDIGTTTVVGTLFDLNNGEVLSVASRLNEQAAFGEDVMSRINYCIANPQGTRQLQQQIIGVLNEIVDELCAESGVGREHVYEITAAGNTTMHHLFLGINPLGLSASPYVPASCDALDTRARSLGLLVSKHAYVHTLPNIAGFVGADTVAVLMASGLMDSDTPKLAIDIGTNGEMVVGSRERMVACSTAAGPAFEGAHISQGMRATSGAIQRVTVEDYDVRLGVIDDVDPTGICGSGLFDAVAELLKAGIIDPSGRILGPAELGAGVPDELKRRITSTQQGNRFLLAQGNGQNGPVMLTQKDVREVQLAKGAICAGIRILLRELNLSVDDLHAILLAGAFGNYIQKESALRVGILPNAPLEKIQFIGNAASAGAQMALVSDRARREAQRIAAFTEYIELAGRPDFQAEFAEAMMF